MANPILMPMPGQMTEACVLVRWLKHEGDDVHPGDVLFEIETDKANVDVEAFEDGVLLRQTVVEGESVPVNAVCGWIGQRGEAIPDEVVPAAAEVPAAAGAVVPAIAPPNATAAAEPTVPVVPAQRRSGGKAVSPRAARLAATAALDLTTIRGTGPDGRITERDVQLALDAGQAGGSEPRRAANAAMAAVPGESVDVEEPRPLSRMRRVIAERMSRSVSTIPPFSITAAIDMTRVLAARDALRLSGTSVSVTDFVLAAAARTLPDYPEVNSRTDGTSIWLRRRVHLGVAVAVPNGLVVVVVRDADRASLGELHEHVARLAEAARDGVLAPDDMTGSTFTVSNLGMFDVDRFTAIVNPGEAAVLAVSSVRPTPVATGDGIAVRPVMNVTLSADHRIVDGELAARFMGALRRRLQDPESFRDEMRNA
jgi:pyruvate dehydrogenase E2 component (dihydrolipoamide acetyltransferase)